MTDKARIHLDLTTAEYAEAVTLLSILQAAATAWPEQYDITARRVAALIDTLEIRAAAGTSIQGY